MSEPSEQTKRLEEQRRGAPGTPALSAHYLRVEKTLAASRSADALEERNRIASIEAAALERIADTLYKIHGRMGLGR